MSARALLPTRRPNMTLDVDWNGHPLTVTAGYDLDGRLREVFANTLSGGDIQASLADSCVLISLALQHGIPLDALIKSMGRVPAWHLGSQSTAPASPIGAILEALREAALDHV